MRFLLDENVELRIGTYLESLGHEVSAIALHYPRSVPDEEVLAIALSEERILVTNDLDFGELVVRRRRPHAGVILFRLPLDTAADEKIERLPAVLARFEEASNQFAVIRPRSV